MKKFMKPTKWSNRVRSALIPRLKNEIPDFDESKLVYGFLSQCGRDGYTGYVSVIYFYYLTAPKENRYRVLDIGYDRPQREMTGELSIETGCSQATYYLNSTEIMKR